jgi:hypothetical protein
MTDQLEAKYGFAKQLSQLSDTELVDCFNAQGGNRGWGNARAYFLHCLSAELRHRSFNSTSILDSSGLQMTQTVILVDGKLQFTKNKSPQERTKNESRR